MELKKRNTKQKQTLINFLKDYGDSHFTAEQIITDLNDSNKISQATIYRLLNTLVEEGIIRKILSEHCKESCYQYVKDRKTCINHYHLICNKCGKVLHFNNELVGNLKNKVKNNINFDIDLKKVTFYGICEQCANE